MKIKINLPTANKLEAKPLPGVEPEAPKPTISKPAIAPAISPILAPKPEVEDDIANIVKQVKEAPEVTKSKIDENPLLDNLDEAFSPTAGLVDKINAIEAVLEASFIPVQELKRACDGVMKELKANPDSVLELEPESISTIVQGYLKAASDEVQATLTKKKGGGGGRKKASNVDPEIQALIDKSKGAALDDSW